MINFSVAMLLFSLSICFVFTFDTIYDNNQPINALLGVSPMTPYVISKRTEQEMEELSSGPSRVALRHTRHLPEKFSSAKALPAEESISLGH